MKSFRVLSIDGGGIRGLYSATVLNDLTARFARKRGVAGLDVGKGFDLIVGTSTGGIIAAALAHGCSPKRIVAIYREAGPGIFSGKRIPQGGWLSRLSWVLQHLNRPIHNSTPLRTELSRIFGNATFGSLYDQRNIALCLTSLSLLRETPRVFKTRHLSQDHFLDDQIPLVEACLASAAAPIFLPLAKVSERPGGTPDVYADGGLWMNNPAIVGLLEALSMTEPEQEIQLLSVGTCPAPAGGNPAEIQTARGLAGWKFGSAALELSMNAQAGAANQLLTRIVAQFERLGRRISYIRAIETPPAPSQAKALGLDNASPESLALLERLGNDDATKTFQSVQQGNASGKILSAIFESMPALPTTE